MGVGKAAQRILLDEPITFAVADGSTSHAPMAEATIHGMPTRLILDTGATDHILTRELVDAIGLEVTEGEAGTDSTGSSVPSWSVSAVDAQFAGQSFELHNVIAIAAPPAFSEKGIGGIISPQHLHPSAWAVLDLSAVRLILLVADEADLSAWLTDRAPHLRLLRLERAPTDGTIMVRAAIEPFDEVVTMLDSGGKRTEMVAELAPGLVAGPAQVTGYGVGGSASYGTEVTGQLLLVGDARVPVTRLTLRDALDDCGVLVGMDVLRGTVLAVTANRQRPVFWMVRR
jgi:hypothetical protein